MSGHGQTLAAVNERTVAIQKNVDRINGSVASNQKRIATLENWRWYVMGAILGTGGLVAFVVGILHHFGVIH